MSNDVSDADQPVALARPEPPRPALSLVMGWLGWFGLGRLVLAAVSVLVVAGGAFWLLKVPTPPVEATLPFAGAAPTSPNTMATSAAQSVAATTPPSSVPSVSSLPSVVVVHVAGAVTQPGVYELDAAARVVDAVAAAGGITADADTNRVNLASPVVDGQRIYLPAVGEVPPIEVVGNAAASSAMAPSTGGNGGTDAAAGPVDLNTATAETLEGLPGIGPATAAAIVDDRDRNGPFASVDDLDRVSGIGPAKLAALAGLVTV